MLSKLITALQSPGLRQTAILIGGNLFAAVFSAVALILISRQLGPVSFSEFMVGYSIMIIIVRMEGLGINVAVQKLAGKYFHQQNWEVMLSDLLQVATTYNLVSLCIFVVLGAIITVPLSQVLHVQSTAIVFGGFLLAGITLLFEYFTSTLQTIHRFTQSVLMMMVQSVTKLLVALSIFFFHFHDVTAAFYAFYFTPVLGIVYGLFAFPEKIHLLPPKTNYFIEKEFRPILKHAAILMATAGIIDYIDIVFVQKYTTPFDTGIYGGIAQLASAVTLVGFSLASVLNARVARYHDRQHMSAYIQKSFFLVALAVIGFLVYIPLARLSIEITIGPAYLAGLPYIIVLMAASFLLIATVPYIALFYAFDSSLYFSLSGLGQLILVLFSGFFLIPHYGLLGAVWGKVLVRSFLFILTVIWAFWAYRKKHGRA